MWLPGHYGKSMAACVLSTSLCRHSTATWQRAINHAVLCVVGSRIHHYLSAPIQIHFQDNKMNKAEKGGKKQNKIPTDMQLIFCSGQQQLLWLTG